MGRILLVVMIMLAIDLLAFQAVKMALAGSGKGLRIGVYIFYWLVPFMATLALIMATFNLDNSLPPGSRTVVRTLMFILYFAKLLIASFILIDDVRRLIFSGLNMTFQSVNLSTSRSKWMSYLGLALGAIPLLSLTYGMIRNPYRYQILRTKLPVKNLDPGLSGFKIIQISDIHSGSFLLKEPVEHSIQLILKENPDVIFFTGDLVNSSASEMEPFVEMFSKLKAKNGVYSIVGNHDYGDYQHWDSPEAKKANFEKLKSIHKSMGWDLLLNENRVVQVGDSILQIIGVENYSAHPRFPKYGKMDVATNGLSEEPFTVLLSHDPSHFDDEITSKYKNVNLTLSGHTHGFQFGVEIPGHFKWSPIQYVYPKWAGLYKVEEQYLYVNRGLGYLGYPGRVGILPEITVITLEPA